MGESRSKSVATAQALLPCLIFSFGAIDCISSYFEPIDFLKLQIINKWLYNIGIGRVQTRFKKLKTYYFTFQRAELPWDKAIVSYSSNGVISVHQSLIMTFWISIQVESDKFFQVMDFSTDCRILYC